MLFDIARVEFHTGKILHLIRYKKIEIWDAVGASIKNQDAACSEPWFDLSVGYFKMGLIIDVPGLYAQSNREL